MRVAAMRKTKKDPVREGRIEDEAIVDMDADDLTAVLKAVRSFVRDEVMPLEGGCSVATSP